MSYYNHYNLDEIAEAMNPPTEFYQTQNIHFDIQFQNISRTLIKVVLDTSITNPKHIQKHLESIYAIGRTKVNAPNKFILYLNFPTYAIQEFHNQILEALDDAFKSFS